MPDSDSPSPWALLLRLIDSDHEVAAEKLLRCRQKLVRRFSVERCHDPEQLADETIERVLNAITKERVITNVWAFFAGVAKHIIQEAHRSPILKEVPLDDLTPLQEPRTRPLDEWLTAIAEQEDLHDCLRQCLEKLDAPDRELLTRYYDAAEGEQLKQARVRLALAARLTNGQLRKRALRLRTKLELCIKTCLGHGNKTQNLS